MSQPVKLSDTLMLDARLMGKVAERSIARQIEYWAKLGRAVESLLMGAHALALCRAQDAAPLSRLLEAVDSQQGRRRVAAYLQDQPFPHYETALGQPGLLVRIEANGARTVGRFVNRRFLAVNSQANGA